MDVRVICRIYRFQREGIGILMTVTKLIEFHLMGIKWYYLVMFILLRSTQSPLNSQYAFLVWLNVIETCVNLWDMRIYYTHASKHFAHKRLKNGVRDFSKYNLRVIYYSLITLDRVWRGEKRRDCSRFSPNVKVINFLYKNYLNLENKAFVLNNGFN